MARKYAGIFRNMQTTNELRQSADAIENGVRIRPSRKGFNLPSSHDDIAFARRARRNWKKFRRNRWKDTGPIGVQDDTN